MCHGEWNDPRVCGTRQTARDFPKKKNRTYEGVSKGFRTGRLEREQEMIQLSATRRNYLAIFLSQYSEFCRHNPLCSFSTSVYCCKRIFRYRLSPETFGYTLVILKNA
jgi:hypothetical protein